MSRPQQPQPGQQPPNGYGQQDHEQRRAYAERPTGAPVVTERRRREPAPRARRRVWPWVLLAVIMIPFLGFAACTALVGGAVSSMDQARQCGTVAIGQSFTHKSGLTLSAAGPTPYQSDNEFIVSAREKGVRVGRDHLHGTDKPVGATLSP